jgi:hypothetical protein
MTKAPFNKKRLFSPQIGLREETYKVRVLGAEHCMVMKLDFSESRLEMPGKFCNTVLENDGEDKLDRSCEKLRSITKSEAGQQYLKCNE